MTALAAVAYVSAATHRLAEDELARLLDDARRHNEARQVTGVLLYDDGAFFQYIEGPAANLDQVYGRIRASRQHHGLIQLLNREIGARNFQGWTMGFTRAPKNVVLSLSQAAWEDMVSSHQDTRHAGSGIRLLLAFWSRAVRR